MSWDNEAFRRGLILLGILLLLIIAFVVRSIRKAVDPSQIIRKWIFTIPLLVVCLIAVPVFSVFGLLLVVACGSVLSWMWTPHIGAAFARPVTSLFDGGDLEPEQRPLYSIAYARQKKGQYLEAIAEVRKQLDKFPNDVEGQMLLAQIQAENLQDLPGAELTVHRLCAQPGHAAANLAFALHSMADWNLKYGLDPDAARRNLEQIMAMLPNSEFELVAARRIAHLADPESLAAGHEAKSYVVPQGVKNIGLLAKSPIFRHDSDPAKATVELVEHLTKFPLDSDAREELAKLYLDHYGRLDLATDQMELLIQQPHQPHHLVVRWLNRLADMQIRSGAGYDAVKQTLDRIIELNPNLATADNARNRLSILKLELKAKEKSQVVKLGSYEQNIGLKQGLPRSR